MPGYEPFLLCDFHVHTRWSDGRLSVREVIDLYGKTGHFDVIAITDHILMKRDLLARAGRLASLGYRQFSVTEDRFDGLPRRDRERSHPGEAALRHARDPGRRDHAEPHPQQEELAHRRAQSQGVDQRRSAGRRHPQGDPPAGRVEHRVPSAPSHDAARGDRHVLSVGSPQARGRARGCLGSGQPRRSVFGDEPEALSVRREQRLPQAEAPVLVEDARAVREEVGRDCRARCGRTSTSRSRSIATDPGRLTRADRRRWPVRSDRGPTAACGPPASRQALRRAPGADQSQVGVSPRVRSRHEHRPGGRRGRAASPTETAEGRFRGASTGRPGPLVSRIRVCDRPRLRIAGDIDQAAALKREVVGHAALNTPHAVTAAAARRRIDDACNS